MDRIIIEVEDRVAKEWRNADPKFRQEVSQKLDQFLNVLFEKRTNDIWPFLEELRVKSEVRGFNDEILQQILNK